VRSQKTLSGRTVAGNDNVQDANMCFGGFAELPGHTEREMAICVVIKTSAKNFGWLRNFRPSESATFNHVSSLTWQIAQNILQFCQDWPYCTMVTVQIRETIDAPSRTRPRPTDASDGY
jgi:hypothetical protein